MCVCVCVCVCVCCVWGATVHRTIPFLWDSHPLLSIKLTCFAMQVYITNECLQVLTLIISRVVQQLNNLVVLLRHALIGGQ